MTFLDHLESFINVMTVTHSLNELALDNEPEELTQAYIATRTDESLKGCMKRIDESLKASMKRTDRSLVLCLNPF